MLKKFFKKKSFLLSILIFSLAGQASAASWIENASDIYYNAGNVGIGTSTPAFDLTIANSGNAQLGIFGGASNYSILRFFDASGPWVMGGGPNYSGYGGPKALNLYSPKTIWFRTGSEERMRITNDGYVGIGTNNPKSLLDLSGNSYTSLRFSDTGAGRVLMDYGTGASNDFRILTGSGSAGSEVWNERFRITSSGRVGVGISNPETRLDIDQSAKIKGLNPSFYFKDTDFTGGDNQAVIGMRNDKFHIWDADTTPWRTIQTWDNKNLRVGIGTTTPTEKLDVAGKVKANEFKFGNHSIKGTSGGGFCIGNCAGVN